MPIIVKSRDEISIMRESGRHLAEVLQMLVDAVRPGLMEIELDEIVRREYKKRDLVPTFLGYYGYPATVCVSVNDKIVHGIPSKREFQEGDIVSIDLGCTHKGFVADSALTFGVGNIGPEKQKLIDVCKEAVWRGIGAARGGARIGDIGHAIQSYVEGEGFSIVREYVGHGVGRAMHEDPQIPNYGSPGTGQVLRPGMVIAIEPMVNVGTWQTKKDPDDWTVRTKDGSLSAHFEHTLAITDGAAEVLTLP
ncbi:MAG TPA: type I methionyl aminopeptidase [Dehalococcoidia bacterium]|jgi:methionyl aminopeptidase|nr:type I methionyl aminopeptidase [Dehalococcoidia bacterium]